MPQRGEVIVHPAGLEFEVLDADPRRVRRLRIRRVEPATVGGPAAAPPPSTEAAEAAPATDAPA